MVRSIVAANQIQIEKMAKQVQMRKKFSKKRVIHSCQQVVNKTS